MNNEIVANFLDIIKNKYALFDGRARRKEFWYFQLAVVAVYIAVIIVAVILGAISSTLGAIIYGLFGIAMLAIIIPSIGLTIRRLHDVDKSGWFILVSLIPLVGGLYLLYLLITEGTVGQNQYGPDPKAGER